MDDRERSLREERAQLLAKIAEVEVELSRVSGAIVGVPHYSVIEGRAHELGREVSRQFQQRQMGEMAAAGQRNARCPTCSFVCEITEHKRRATSIDGPLEVQELKGHCPMCSRDFFPSTGSPGF